MSIELGKETKNSKRTKGCKEKKDKTMKEATKKYEREKCRRKYKQT
jgi:hypothetical protein